MTGSEAADLEAEKREREKMSTAAKATTYKLAYHNSNAQSVCVAIIQLGSHTYKLVYSEKLYSSLTYIPKSAHYTPSTQLHPHLTHLITTLPPHTVTPSRTAPPPHSHTLTLHTHYPPSTQSHPHLTPSLHPLHTVTPSP